MRGARRGRNASGQPREHRHLRTRTISLAGTLVIALSATGCSSDRGLAIEVDVGKTGATSVELFIGKDGCTSETRPPGVRCSGIKPQGVTTELAGDIWFRDDSQPYTAKVTDGTATFQLKTDESITLPIVIAVGSKDGDPTHPVGMAVLRKLPIPAGSARIATTTLATTNPVTARPSSAEAEDRAIVWSEKTLPSSCIAVEHWQSGKATYEFVVPFDDPDCDDVPQVRECNANDYRGTSPGGLAAKPDCFGPGTNACVLGSRACSDDTGPVPNTCVAQQNQAPVCVPSQLCGCETIEGGCSLDKIVNVVEIPHVECFIPARGLPSAATACPGDNTGPINLDSFFPANSKCGKQPLLGSLQLAAYSTGLTVSGAVMELASPEGACNFPITWKSGTHTGADGMADHGVIKLQTSAATLLVPIVFRFVPSTCAVPSQFHCGPAGNPDSLWSCARL
jgi:hypothetical protein